MTEWTEERRQKQRDTRARKREAQLAKLGVADAVASRPSTQALGKITINELPRVVSVEPTNGHVPVARVIDATPVEVDLGTLLDSTDFNLIDGDRIGALFGSIRSAYDRCGVAMKQARSRYEAEVGRVPCRTCKKPIDITRPGTYQCQSGYDDAHTLVNFVWCSQECLLGWTKYQSNRRSEEARMVKPAVEVR